MFPFKLALVALLSLATFTSAQKQRLTARQAGNNIGQLKQNTKPILSLDKKSVILDLTTTIRGTDLRFRVSAPRGQFKGQTGGAANPPGLDVLLHGDGGQSFKDFPNQNVQGNLMGVVVLAPNQKRLWGGGGGLNRPDGPLHSALIDSLIQDVLPDVVKFDPKNVQFTGVSGGSLLLSGFFVPTFGATYSPGGVVFNCGGLAPQVAVKGDLSKLKMHFQSTGNDLAELRRSIPQALTAYVKIQQKNGLTGAALDAVLTADAKLSTKGGHCEFDGKDFVSGVQLMADNRDNIQTGKGVVNGVQLLKSVEKNQNIYA